VNRTDAAKALEIIRIERKDALARIHIRDGDQAGIMNFALRSLVCAQEKDGILLSDQFRNRGSSLRAKRVIRLGTEEARSRIFVSTRTRIRRRGLHTSPRDSPRSPASLMYYVA